MLVALLMVRPWQWKISFAISSPSSKYVWWMWGPSQSWNFFGFSNCDITWLKILFWTPRQPACSPMICWPSLRKAGIQSAVLMSSAILLFEVHWASALSFVGAASTSLMSWTCQSSLILMLNCFKVSPVSRSSEKKTSPFLIDKTCPKPFNLSEILRESSQIKQWVEVFGNAWIKRHGFLSFWMNKAKFFGVQGKSRHFKYHFF